MNADSRPIAFVDTNIWLYAFIRSQDEERHQQALDILTACQPVVSLQVINEVCVNLLRKVQYPETQLRLLIASFYAKYPVIPLEQSVLLTASDLRQRYAFSFWDSLVVASALESPAEFVYSEDMQDGLIVDGRVHLKNPFSKRKLK